MLGGAGPARPHRSGPTGPILPAVDGSRGGAAAVDLAFAETALRGFGILAVHV